MTRDSITALVLAWPSVARVTVLESFAAPAVVVIVRGDIHPTTLDAIATALGNERPAGVEVFLFTEAGAMTVLVGATLTQQVGPEPTKASPWWSLFAAGLILGYSVIGFWFFLHSWLSPIFAGGLG